jgi:hypothetical protein
MGTSDAFQFVNQRLDLLEQLICVQAEEIKLLQQQNEKLARAHASTTGWIGQIEAEVVMMKNQDCD